MALPPYDHGVSGSTLGVLIVIPRSEVSTCGLADHAAVLASSVSRRGIPVSICPWPEPWRSASRAAILVEFTPLAYSRVGLPWPLLLRVLRIRLDCGRVVTYFHELPFTNGVTWKRLIAVLFQQAFCMLLSAVSNAVVVNQKAGVRWLGRLRRRSLPVFLPSFSNVGECDDVPPPSDRSCSVVIFGSPGKRRHAHELVAALGGYRKIFDSNVIVFDIGDPLILPASLLSEVQLLGALPADQVFDLLLQCRYGFFYSQPSQFSKSGVFAAYCAAGVLPIIASPALGDSEYFLSHRDLVRDLCCPERLLSVWLNCRRWFFRYSTEASAEQLCDLLQARPAPASQGPRF